MGNWFRKRKQQKADHMLKPSIQLKGLQDNMEKNAKTLRTLYEDCEDFVVRSFQISGTIPATLFYIEGLSNTEAINENILKPLMWQSVTESREIQGLLESKLPVSQVGTFNTFADSVTHLSAGHPILLIEGKSTGFFFGLQKWEKRSIEKPTSEPVVHGSQEGFTETLAVNRSMLRRIIRSPDLKMKSITVGSRTQTKVMIAYMKGIANPKVIKEVNRRLEQINIDGVLDSGYIEELIEDNSFSIFPQIQNTERVDVVAASLLEGRVAILTEGTPFCLIVPIGLISLLQSAEDYYNRFLAETFIRVLRFGFIFLSVVLPAIYLALLSHHSEMVPTNLLIRIASDRKMIPYPTLVELLLMALAYEALLEAGIRLPRQVGTAVTIVGALVIGEAGVSAGLVSAPVVVVTAITAITSFVVPRYNLTLTLRPLRLALLLLAALWGIIGVMYGLIAIAIHLCSLYSFGLPYLTPVAPLKKKDLKDVFIRAPWWKMKTRPHLSGSLNNRDKMSDQAPDSSKGEDER